MQGKKLSGSGNRRPPLNQIPFSAILNVSKNSNDQSYSRAAEKIIPFAKKNKITYVALFGSFARGEQTKKSDVDLVVRFSKPIGLFDFVGIKMDLEKKLKRKVDLVTEKSINKHVKKFVMKDLKTIYEEII